MEEIIKELQELSESMFDEKLYAWSDNIDEIVDKLKAQTDEIRQADLLVIPKIAEEMEYYTKSYETLYFESENGNLDGMEDEDLYINKNTVLELLKKYLQ